MDLAEKIKKEKDITKLGNFETQISAKLKGHEKLEFLVLKRGYELREEGLRGRLSNLENPGRLKSIIDRRSQEEKDEEIKVVGKLYYIAEEESKGLKEEESKEQRKEREREIRSNIISEIVDSIRRAKTEELRTGKEASEVAVDIVALARIIEKNAKYNSAIMGASGDSKQYLEEEAKRAIVQQQGDVEKELSLVGLTLETEEERINGREKFYENSQNLDEEFQAKSNAFISIVREIKTIKDRIAVIEQVHKI
jgi:hypothetical protein